MDDQVERATQLILTTQLHAGNHAGRDAAPSTNIFPWISLVAFSLRSMPITRQA